MATTIDIGEAKNIHPKNKLDVGKRLALNARALVYEETNLVYSGPMYKSMSIEGDTIRLKFAHVGSGLESTTGENLEGFAIAGSDDNFVWAEAAIDGNDVVVFNSQVPKPEKVLYGWANNPIISLFNKEGLPASPFRTDGE
jgi:sialate O-acetylesterase